NHQRLFERLMNDGTTVTMMNTGTKHTMMGKMILTVSLAAFSSVRCLRLRRISADWMRRVSAIGTPCFCACSSAVARWRLSTISRPSQQRAHSRARGHAGVRVSERVPQLVGQRPLGGRRHPGQRGVEAEAGLD